MEVSLPSQEGREQDSETLTHFVVWLPLRFVPAVVHMVALDEAEVERRVAESYDGARPIRIEVDTPRSRYDEWLAEH